MNKIYLLFMSVVLVSCFAEKSADIDPQAIFFTALKNHCGSKYQGKLVSNDEADAGFKDAIMIAHFQNCNEQKIAIPFQIGEDRSRTWIVTKLDNGLRLKHDHRHEDGTEDILSQYGGDTIDEGTASRQNFPADDYSKALFIREDIAVSTDNIWSLEINERILAYELNRPNRHFRVEFDLTNPTD